MEKKGIRRDAARIAAGRQSAFASSFNESPRVIFGFNRFSNHDLDSETDGRKKSHFFKLTQEGRNSLEQISAILRSRSCTKLLRFSPLFPKNDNNLLINADVARSYSHDTKSSTFNC